MRRAGCACSVPYCRCFAGRLKEFSGIGEASRAQPRLLCMGLFSQFFVGRANRTGRLLALTLRRRSRRHQPQPAMGLVASSRRMNASQRARAVLIEAGALTR